MSNKIKKIHQKSGSWVCFVDENHSLELTCIDGLFNEIEKFSKTLKDDRRSLVKLGDINGLKVIAKQPRDKNDRKWARVLSWFGPAEARKTFTSLLEFKDKGIESLTPICFLERKQFGMVFDSWLLYEYRDGRVSNRSHLVQIVEQLKKLHQNGYRHEDPNFSNFLIDVNGQFFLIDCKGKSRSGRFTDYYDFMLLEGNDGFEQAEVEALIDVDHFSVGYWRAQAYRAYIRVRTKWKMLVGRKRSKDQQH